MDQKHVMVDIETIGTNPRCVIFEIAAVMFDPFGDGVAQGIDGGNAFRYAVQIEGQNAEIDSRTLVWHLKDPDRSAHLSATQADGSAVPLETALIALSSFLKSRAPSSYWAKSPQFDYGILEGAMNLHGIFKTWDFRSLKDVRTLSVFDDLIPPPANEGKPHTALDDAIYQVHCVQAVCRRMPQ